MDANNPYGAPLAPVVAAQARDADRNQRIPWRWLRRRWGFVGSVVLVSVLLLPAWVANIFLGLAFVTAYFKIGSWIARAIGATWSFWDSPRLDWSVLTLSGLLIYGPLAFYFAKTSRFRWICHGLVVAFMAYEIFSNRVLFYQLPGVLLGLAAGEYFARRQPD